jgi:hypothetical protein
MRKTIIDRETKWKRIIREPEREKMIDKENDRER